MSRIDGKFLGIGYEKVINLIFKYNSLFFKSGLFTSNEAGKN